MTRRIVIFSLLVATALSWLPMIGSIIESDARPIEYLNWESAGIALRRVGQSVVVFRNAPGGGNLLAIPLWIFPILFSAYPLFAGFRALHRHHNPERGLCEKCGYNLTGNSTGTCPECGTKFDKARA